MASDERMRRLKELLRLFRWERAVYLLMSTGSCALLVWAGSNLLRSGSSDVAAIAGMVGGSGGMLVAIGRLLKMWDTAVAVVFGREGGGS